MKYLSMRFALILFAIFCAALLMCSCSNGTSHVLVTPRIYNDTTSEYFNLNKQVWRVETDELSMLSEGDTVNFHQTYDNRTSSNLCIIVKIEAED